jgi:hypothetical protein
VSVSSLVSELVAVLAMPALPDDCHDSTTDDPDGSDLSEIVATEFSEHVVTEPSVSEGREVFEDPSYDDGANYDPMLDDIALPAPPLREARRRRFSNLSDAVNALGAPFRLRETRAPISELARKLTSDCGTQCDPEDSGVAVLIGPEALVDASCGDILRLLAIRLRAQAALTAATLLGNGPSELAATVLTEPLSPMPSEQVAAELSTSTFSAEWDLFCLEHGIFDMTDTKLLTPLWNAKLAETPGMPELALHSDGACLVHGILDMAMPDTRDSGDAEPWYEQELHSLRLRIGSLRLRIDAEQYHLQTVYDNFCISRHFLRNCDLDRRLGYDWLISEALSVEDS